MTTVLINILLCCVALAVKGEVFYTEQNRTAIAGSYTEQECVCCASKVSHFRTLHDWNSALLKLAQQSRLRYNDFVIYGWHNYYKLLTCNYSDNRHVSGFLRMY